MNLLIGAPLAVQGQSKPAPAHERWYSLLLGDRPIGWMHSTTTRESDRWVSHDHFVATLGRGMSAVTVEAESRFVETLEGKPIEARSMQKLATLSSNVTLLRFTDKEIEVISSRSTNRVPAPAQRWFPPMAAERYIAEQMKQGAKKITYYTLDPSLGPLLAETTMERVGHEDLQVMGKVVPAILFNSSISVLTGNSARPFRETAREYRDAQGRPVKTVMSLMPGMVITVLEADKDLATQKINPPELLARTLIKLPKPMAYPRNTTSATYDLSFTAEDKHKPDIPSTGYQHVVKQENGGVRIMVDLARPVISRQDLPDETHRRPSAMITSDHPKIKELLAKALSDGPPQSPAEAAEVLRAYVRQYVNTRDLSVGLASAAEVAITAQGDCTEHAVLLAALLRAQGIPSRTVSGLIYVDRFLETDHIFAYHMWTQAWLNPDGQGSRWMDLDATLDDPFDAAHITLATNSFAESQLFNDLVALSPILGNLRITVVNSK